MVRMVVLSQREKESQINLCSSMASYIVSFNFDTHGSALVQCLIATLGKLLLILRRSEVSCLFEMHAIVRSRRC